MDDATDLMEVSLQLYLQDASRSRNVPTAVLSSSNPAVAGSEEHSSHKHAVAARGLSGPISLASERILTTQEIDERKEQYLGTDEGVCVGACDVVKNFLGRPTNGSLPTPLPPRAPKRPKSCASGSTLAPAGSSLLPLSSGRNTPGSSLNTSTISLRPLSALSQNRSTIRSEADATGTDCDFLLQKLVDERYSCNKILLRPKIKFPVQIEMAFSQIR